MNFCNQNNPGNSFSNISNQSSSTAEKSGCGCGSGSVSYEPLTKAWFKEYAGIIALAVTLIMVLVNR